MRCADTIVSSYVTPNSSKTAAASCMVGKSESLPIITPTRGAFARSPCSFSVRPSSSARVRSSCRSLAVTVTCAILRPTRFSALPYQWRPAPGTESARCSGWRVCSMVSAPNTLSISAAPARILGAGHGRSRTARRCISNWSISQASIV